MKNTRFDLGPDSEFAEKISTRQEKYQRGLLIGCMLLLAIAICSYSIYNSGRQNSGSQSASTQQSFKK